MSEAAEQRAENAEAMLAELGGGVYGTKFGRTYINEALKGVDANGNVVGYVFGITNSNGYEGDIKLSLGVTADGTVYGIAFTELKETPGKGMLAAEPAFMDQFKDKAATFLKMNKSGASDNSDDGIDAVTGATITSTAVVNAVNAGLDFYRVVFAGGN